MLNFFQHLFNTNLPCFVIIISVVCWWNFSHKQILLKSILIKDKSIGPLVWLISSFVVDVSLSTEDLSFLDFFDLFATGVVFLTGDWGDCGAVKLDDDDDEDDTDNNEEESFVLVVIDGAAVVGNDWGNCW